MIELRRRKHSEESAPSSRLPMGYQKVEYLKSRGYMQGQSGSGGGNIFAPCIKTGITSRLNTKIKCKLKLGILSQLGGVGAVESGSKGWLFIGGYNDSNIHAIFSVDSRGNNDLSILNDGNFHNVTISNGITIIDGEECETQLIDKIATLEIYAFCANLNYSINSRTEIDIQISELEIYENDEIVRSLIPCYRKVNAEAGMYDLVSGKFYTNAGTGEFIVGADVIE